MNLSTKVARCAALAAALALVVGGLRAQTVAETETAAPTPEATTVVVEPEAQRGGSGDIALGAGVGVLVGLVVVGVLLSSLD